MPCASERYDTEIQTILDMKCEVDKLTRLLCLACRVLDDNAIKPLNMDEVYEWWVDHQKADRRREERERRESEKTSMQLIALGKLTPEERTALGY